MEDSEAPRPTFQRRRLGASLRRVRLAAGLPKEQVAVANDCSLSKVLSIENEVGHRPRIEIVIETQTVRLSLDDEVTAETAAALAAMASGLRQGSPTGMAAAVGDHAAGPQAVLPHAHEPASVADGQGVPGPRVIARFPRAVGATFRVVKDVVTELIARVLGHVLGFPP
jgi:hypothetical protein